LRSCRPEEGFEVCLLSAFGVGGEAALKGEVEERRMASDDAAIVPEKAGMEVQSYR
jgi:hypothetical protein